MLETPPGIAWSSGTEGETAVTSEAGLSNSGDVAKVVNFMMDIVDDGDSKKQER